MHTKKDIRLPGRTARWLNVIIVVCVCFAAGAQGDTSERVWVLRFEDNFERTVLGEEWRTNDAIIQDGKMLLGRNGPACAKLVRPFPGDVKIEFTAQAYEKKPPCDLSVTLAAERFRTMSWNYLLAFGGVNNTVNKLTGGRRLKKLIDKNPERLIEPGRIYHLVAAKEGKQLSLTLDGKRLLESTDEEVMGGPGFDAVGLVTWHGMYVDNVRVYECSVPHPDTPQYVMKLAGLILTTDSQNHLVGPPDLSSKAKKAVEAYNQNNLARAETLFASLDGEVRAAGLAYVYGHLNHDESPQDFQKVAQLFNELAQTRPNDQRLANYAWAASLFGQIRLFPRSEKQCGLLIALGPDGNPFYDKARLYRARFLRANGQEGHVAEVLATAQKMFRELKAKAPDNVQLRELTGESVPWGEEFINRYPNTPRWAALLNEMYTRQLAIMNWWFTERQYPDGQLGGGWGDDVELLRSWGPFALISNADPVVRDGIEKLCQGVWDHVLRDGYAPDIGDVEHSAEPSADSIPTMLALRYGDPLWYERNLASCRRIRDHYTAVDNKGFMRFKSGHFGGDGASEHLQHGGDNHYCARPMKHFLWAAWYGNEEAKNFYLDWVRGWTSATMTASYTKPAGVPPASIWYPSGDIAPPNGVGWNDPVYNIYGCCWIGDFRIQDAFLAGYYFSGDQFFLQPLHAWMRFYESQMPPDAPKNPTIEKNATAWAIRNSKDTWKSEMVLSQYRWMTADSMYDELFNRQKIRHRLHIPGEFDDLVARLEAVVKKLRTNFNLYTREVLQTDRAGLPGSEVAFSAFTGAVREWKDAGVPTMAVTWEFPHPDFAAIVPYATEDHLRVWIYNFSDDTTRVGMYLWQLRPGRYEVRTALLGKGQGYVRKHQWNEPVYITLRHKGDIYQVDIPSQKEYVIDLRLVKPQPRPSGVADPAIAQRDVTITHREDGRFTVNVTVHNLGNRVAKNLTVILQQAGRQESSEIARKTIDLPGSRELQPRCVTISFVVADPKTEVAIVLDPQQKVPELNELNNRVDVPRFSK